MTTREQLAAECKALFNEYWDIAQAEILEGRMDRLDRAANRTLRDFHSAINALASWQPEQQTVEPVMIKDRIDALVERHGSLRALARVMACDVGYLSRLRSGDKTEPSPEFLAAMGLQRVVTYVDKAPAQKPAKQAVKESLSTEPVTLVTG
jgi:hypothetical protein